MKEITRYGFILGVICVLAAGLLALANSLTQPKIIAQGKDQEQRSLREIFPEAGSFEAVESSSGQVMYYKVYDIQDKLNGFIFKAEGKGYSGSVETIAGINLSGEIQAIKVLNQNETPGLGNRILLPFFTSQFSHKDILGLGQVKVIAGATISSRAVINSVQKKAEEVEALIKNAK